MKRKNFGSSKTLFREESSGRNPLAWRKFVPARPVGKVTTQLPGVKYNPNACSTLKGNPCASKLVFVREDEAGILGTKPGPNVLYCLGEKKPGALVPVSSAAEATAKGRAFCACTKGEKKRTKSCTPIKPGQNLASIKKPKKVKEPKPAWLAGHNRFGLYGYGKR